MFSLEIRSSRKVLKSRFYFFKEFHGKLTFFMCGFCFFLSAAIEDLQALYKLAVGFDGVVSVNVYAKPRKPVSWYKMTSDGSKSLLIKQNDKFELEGDLKGYNITGRGTLVIKDVSKSDDGKYEMRVQVVGSQIKKETEILVGSK